MEIHVNGIRNQAVVVSNVREPRPSQHFAVKAARS
jgi:hypothetical protein